MLSINPDAATRDDVARLASDLMEAQRELHSPGLESRIQGLLEENSRLAQAKQKAEAEVAELKNVLRELPGLVATLTRANEDIFELRTSLKVLASAMELKDDYLDEIEWSGTNNKSQAVCPACWEPRSEGKHTDDCSLKAARDAGNKA